MFQHILRTRLAGLVLAAPFCNGAALQADCPCQQGAAFAAGAGYGYVDDFAGPQFGEVGPQTQSGTVTAPTTGMPTYSAGSPVTPPPGTLGQTYQLRSDPVPADKHPRAGMIVIHAPGATDVLVQDTNNFRTRDKLEGFEDQNHRGTWHFESIMLLPGQPNIHRVVAIYPTDDGQEGSRVEVRFVRFIMGRVVYLDI